MFIQFVTWIRAEWRRYLRLVEMARLDREIEHAARILGLIDLGLPQELWVNEKGVPLIRMHFACPVPARAGVTLVSPRRVYWCYRCRVTWHFEGDDDDDDGRGRKPRRKSPPGPTRGHPSPGLEESEKVLRRIMEKKSPHPNEH